MNFPNKSSSETHSFEDDTMVAKLESYEDDAENDDSVRICKWVDCNAVFYDRASLSKHIERAHVDQRKGDDFTCFWAACQRKYRAFNARYKLLIHMRVHSGEKPNKCGYRGCSKAFSRLENLKIHVRSHTGERPYVCMHALCAKAFSNSSDRAKHQRTHLTAKPYACSVPHCRKSYTDPSSLRKHVKNHSQRDQLLARSKSGSLSLSDGTRPDAEDQSEAGKFAKSATAVDGDLVRFSLRCHVLSRVDGQTEALGALGALGDLPTPSQEDLDAWIS